MFPPTYTDDLQELVTCMFQSLERAGANWAGDCMRIEIPDGDRIAVKLKTKLPRGSWKFVAGFIKEYGMHSGWVIKNIRYRKFRVEFSCFPALSQPAAHSTDPESPPRKPPDPTCGQTPEP